MSTGFRPVLRYFSAVLPPGRAAEVLVQQPPHALKRAVLPTCTWRGLAAYSG